MTPHEYLSGVLMREAMQPQEIAALQGLRATIEAGLRQRFGSAPRFYYGGSYGKGTMLRSVYDLDIVMYFPASEGATLSQLFQAVHEQLLALRYVVKPRTVALRLPYEGGFHIDLVPGRAQDAGYKYATLFKNASPPSTLQTSVKVHIDAVAKTGIANVVRLLKLWRFQQQLDLPTFALEIAAGRALAGIRKDDLGLATLTVFKFLANNAGSMRLVDPANTNNEIELTAVQRQAVGAAAQRAVRATNWGGIVA